MIDTGPDATRTRAQEILVSLEKPPDEETTETARFRRHIVPLSRDTVPCLVSFIGDRGHHMMVTYSPQIYLRTRSHVETYACLLRSSHSRLGAPLVAKYRQLLDGLVVESQ